MPYATRGRTHDEVVVGLHSERRLVFPGGADSAIR